MDSMRSTLRPRSEGPKHDRDSSCSVRQGVTNATTSGSRPESPASGELRDPPKAPPGFHWLREGERRRYPDYLLPIAGQLVPDDEGFAEARERMLLDYGPQTARAYRADLDDIYAWAVRRGFDVLHLRAETVRQYVALQRRRHYSESTIRRRSTALRRLLCAG